jgi:primosomal protein N' (replication factor Y)
MYAEIIIPLALPKNYTWMIPTSMESDVMIGMRVEVMLGANKRYAGIIKYCKTRWF